MWFDPYAKLAEIRGHPLATSATIATPAPKARAVSQMSRVSQAPAPPRPAPSVANVATVATPPPGTVQAEPPPSRADGLDADAGAYADFLRLYGPSTYGVAARELGIGGTRAWRAEERLRALGLMVIENGKAKATEGGRR